MLLATDRLLAEIEGLYADRRSHFVRVARAITGDRERATEAVQDGFADAIRSRKGFRGDAPLEAWVWRAVVNAARKAARFPLVEVTAQQRAAPELPPAWPELAPLIASLPERQRLVLFPIAPSRRRGRWPATLLAAALLAGALVPAVAFSARVRTLLGFPITHPVLGKAELLVSGPVGNGFYAHSWVSPSSTGGRCAFTTADHDPAPVSPARGGGGAGSIHDTTPVGQASKHVPLALGMSIARRLEHGDPARWVPPIVDGSLLPQLHTVRVEIQWRGGSHPINLHHDSFIGGGPFLYKPPFRAFPFTVVAYDATSHEVARKKIESPSLLLVSHGWKEYARKYHAWERNRPRP